MFLLIFSAVVFFAPEGGGYFLEYNNFIEANSLLTPQHIAPVWYFTPFYSMLRATTEVMVNVLSVIAIIAFIAVALRRNISFRFKLVTLVCVAIAVFLLQTFEAKFWGVVVMGGSVIILFFLPWLDHSPAKSIRYRPVWHRYVYAVFVFFFLLLGYLGVEPVGIWGSVAVGPLNLDVGQTISQFATLVYFGFFLLMPWWSSVGRFKPVPDRVTYTAH